MTSKSTPTVTDSIHGLHMPESQDASYTHSQEVQQRQRVRVTRREKAARRVAGKGGVGEGGKEREKEKERKLLVLQYWRLLRIWTVGGGESEIGTQKVIAI